MRLLSTKLCLIYFLGILAFVNKLHADNLVAEISGLDANSQVCTVGTDKFLITWRNVDIERVYGKIYNYDETVFKDTWEISAEDSLRVWCASFDSGGFLVMFTV